MVPVIASCSLFVIACTCNDITASTSSVEQTYSFPGKTEASGYIDGERRKRAIGYAVRQGMKAAKALLKGSKPVPVNKNYVGNAENIRQYEKAGGYKQTMNEFYSVHPREVKVESFEGGNVQIFGRVGDRTLLVDKNGYFGKSSLEIIQRIGTGKSKRDLIIYID